MNRAPRMYLSVPGNIDQARRVFISLEKLRMEHFSLRSRQYFRISVGLGGNTIRSLCLIFIHARGDTPLLFIRRRFSLALFDLDQFICKSCDIISLTNRKHFERKTPSLHKQQGHFEVSMKFFIVLAIALFGFLCSFASAQIEEMQLRVVLPGNSCSSHDKRWILGSFYRVGGRNLRHNKLNFEENELGAGISDNDHRQMIATFKQASCKTSCSGFTDRSCLAPACKGYRRELRDVTSYSRDLQVDPEAWCESAKTNARRMIRMVMIENRISSACITELVNLSAIQMDCLSVIC